MHIPDLILKSCFLQELFPLCVYIIFFISEIVFIEVITTKLQILNGQTFVNNTISSNLFFFLTTNTIWRYFFKRKEIISSLLPLVILFAVFLLDKDLIILKWNMYIQFTAWNLFALSICFSFVLYLCIKLYSFFLMYDLFSWWFAKSNINHFKGSYHIYWFDKLHIKNVWNCIICSLPFEAFEIIDTLSIQVTIHRKTIGKKKSRWRRLRTK